MNIDFPVQNENQIKKGKTEISKIDQQPPTINQG